MSMCPAGHQSEATDFCYECGLPIAADAPSAPAGAQQPAESPAPGGQKCPNCGAFSPPDALFCEGCGYDFITGTMPRGTASELLGLSQTPEPPSPTPDDKSGKPADELVAYESSPDAAVADAPETPETPVADNDQAAVASPSPAEGDASTSGRGALKAQRWVAEVWIDPDWYRLQDSPDPLPSPGLPEIFGLPADGALIGRVSRSRNITPDIDCGTDSGCSRRQAQLTADGRRWWIEDQESANGTFVGLTGEPLPSTPIKAGRTELTTDSRIYVGAWTRIVIRLATEDEHGLFT